MDDQKSRVVWVRTGPGRGEGTLPSAATLRRMIELGLAELTGLQDPSEAWARYFRPKDVIGVKVNCLGGRHMCTRPSLASAAADSLQAAGVPPHRIIVWDRTSRELKRCGFSLNRRGSHAYRCFGTDERGLGYEPKLTVHGSVGSLFSTVLTRHCTATINMPVLKDHALCGLTAALKNVFGALHNPNKYHEDGCDPYIADANAVPFVRAKHRLVICDALLVQYKGGPSFHPQWARPLGSVLLAEDPVALDSICASILDRIRKEEGLPTLQQDGDVPVYLKTAADSDHRIGRYRRSEIDLVERSV